jgi:hypothetical protein
MRWRRAEPVQAVGAMIAIDKVAMGRLTEALCGKSPLFHMLPVEHGKDWAVVFAASTGGAPEPILPRLAGAVPLHEAAKGWWLPIGVELEAPTHVHAALWSALEDRSGVRPPAVVVPRLKDGDASTPDADVFLIRDPAPFSDTALAARGQGADDR